MPNVSEKEFIPESGDILTISPHNGNLHVEFFIDNSMQERWAVIDISDRKMLEDIRDYLTLILNS